MSTMSAGEKPWPISVILDGDVARAAVAAHSFDAEMDPAAQVALLEVALPSEASDGPNPTSGGSPNSAQYRPTPMMWLTRPRKMMMATSAVAPGRARANRIAKRAEAAR